VCGTSLWSIHNKASTGRNSCPGDNQQRQPQKTNRKKTKQSMKDSFSKDDHPPLLGLSVSSDHQSFPSLYSWEMSRDGDNDDGDDDDDGNAVSYAHTSSVDDATHHDSWRSDFTIHPGAIRVRPNGITVDLSRGELEGPRWNNDDTVVMDHGVTMMEHLLQTTATSTTSTTTTHAVQATLVDDNDTRVEALTRMVGDLVRRIELLQPREQQQQPPAAVLVEVAIPVDDNDTRVDEWPDTVENLVQRIDQLQQQQRASTLVEVAVSEQPVIAMETVTNTNGRIRTTIGGDTSPIADSIQATRQTSAAHLEMTGNPQVQTVGSNPSVVAVPLGTQEVIDYSLCDAEGEKGTYTGKVLRSTDIPEGFGRMVYHNGSVYEGAWYVFS
jgi:hypothetical protein